MRSLRADFATWCALIGANLLLAAAGLALGSVSIPWEEVLGVLLDVEGQTPGTWRTIVLELRAPRVLTAMVSGAGLAVCGLSLQSFFSNPLAGPYVLGVSSGASLGVALAVLSSFDLGGRLVVAGSWEVFVMAVLGATLVLGLLLLVASRASNLTLLILGVLLGYAASALVTLLLHFAPDSSLRGFLAWSFGSFSGVDARHLAILTPLVLAGLLGTGILAKSLDVLLLGRDAAASLGVEIRRVRWGVILVTSLLAGGITAACGPIAFLGVIVPHLTRGILGLRSHRVLIPGCVLVGSALALGADLIARMPGSSTVLPLNAVMALLGAPVLVLLVWRHRDREWTT